MSTTPADPAFNAASRTTAVPTRDPGSTGFAARARDYRRRVERVLEACLPDPAQAPVELHAAMRYAVLGGGKRIRPLLVYATGEVVGVRAARLDAAAAAVELVHAFSLVHDDLPAMDDDALRRGQPTTHKAFGEATAILAGDALQVLAFDVISRAPALAWQPEIKVEMMAALARATGSLGMTGGQAMDLAAEGGALGRAALERMYSLKTGALIHASVQMAISAASHLGHAQRRALETYGQRAGLAFQVWDDVLDVAGKTEVIGKQAGADLVRDKATWPALFGLGAARERAGQLYEEAVGALALFGDRAELLLWLSDYIVNREY